MNTSNIIYQGKLRTEATHKRSGKSILTDAPVDNQGQGGCILSYGSGGHSPRDMHAYGYGDSCPKAWD